MIKQFLSKVWYFILFLMHGMLQGQTAEEIKTKEFSLMVAKKYCSNAFEIISNEDASAVHFWMNGVNEELDIINFTTNVHESLHGYDISLGDYPNEGFFIDKDIKLVVPVNDAFPSAELHPNDYPEKVRNTFRYPTYIFNEGESNISIFKEKGPSKADANRNGIHGLLGEFNAYYHDNKALFELLSAMFDHPNDPFFEKEKLKNELLNFYAGASYFEFNSFMAYYLKYAKNNRPKVYKDLMSNKALRVAYTLMETNWRDLLTRVYSDERMWRLFQPSDFDNQIFIPEARAIMNDFIIPQNELPQYQNFFANKIFDEDLIDRVRSQLEQNKIEKENEDFSNSGFDLTELGINLDTTDVNIEGLGFGLDGFNFEEGVSETLVSNGTEFKVKQKEEGFFYLIYTQVDDLFDLADHADFKASNKNAGVYKENGKYYLFLDKTDSKTKAASLLNQYKSKYPSLKIEN